MDQDELIDLFQTTVEQELCKHFKEVTSFYDENKDSLTITVREGDELKEKITFSLEDIEDYQDDIRHQDKLNTRINSFITRAKNC